MRLHNKGSFLVTQGRIKRTLCFQVKAAGTALVWVYLREVWDVKEDRRRRRLKEAQGDLKNLLSFRCGRVCVFTQSLFFLSETLKRVCSFDGVKCGGLDELAAVQVREIEGYDRK